MKKKKTYEWVVVVLHRCFYFFIRVSIILQVKIINRRFLFAIIGEFQRSAIVEAPGENAATLGAQKSYRFLTSLPISRANLAVEPRDRNFVSLKCRFVRRHQRGIKSHCDGVNRRLIRRSNSYKSLRTYDTRRLILAALYTRKLSFEINVGNKLFSCFFSSPIHSAKTLHEKST